MPVLRIKNDFQTAHATNKSSCSMNATITIQRDARIHELFAPEDKDIGRAQYTITEDDTHIMFHITAEDAVAMRASLNAITKLLTIWEKTEHL